MRGCVPPDDPGDRRDGGQSLGTGGGGRGHGGGGVPGSHRSRFAEAAAGREGEVGAHEL